MKNKTSFNFEKGRIVSSKYEIINKLGQGWEGEVYLVKEIDTHIERAAKFFYPERNPKNKTVKAYAKKLHKLRACNSLIKYIAKDTLEINDEVITYLLSDFVEGYTFDTYINSWHPEGMPFYQALHLFYSVVKALEEIHINKEWHGDVHSDNIIIQKSSLSYDLKLVDVFHLAHGEKGSIQQDVYDLCYLLYDSIGGKLNYKSQPKIVKDICCGLKKTLIKKKFRNATQIRVFLENSTWE
ncbi:protein kinase [Halobacteriovorax sp. HLS]|uniref:protein kinase domain-containing protein n=1 Tax=Halobacteriovorax sp. HLS TaxID=2234000 RepID=UPI000FD996FD|nr:protein kinase [Halobacteriovorax sp. HLS]